MAVTDLGLGGGGFWGSGALGPWGSYAEQRGMGLGLGG